MSVPTQRDLHRADARRFNALRDLENSLMSYQLELPSSGRYGERHPDPSRLNQILGAYALTLKEIETELDPDLSPFDVANRCWAGIANACATVPTALYQVRDLPGTSAFRGYMSKALVPEDEKATESGAHSPGPEAPTTEATSDTGVEASGDGYAPDQPIRLSAPSFVYQYPPDFPAAEQAEQLAIESARQEANSQLERKSARSPEELESLTGVAEAGMRKSDGSSSRHEVRVKSVERNFGSTGKPDFVEFYQPLQVKNPEFCAWKRNDHKHCGRAKWLRLDKAADNLAN